jgi:hypothetical protein
MTTSLLTREDPVGTDRVTLPAERVGALERALEVSGLREASLRKRYSVVFVFPGMGVGNVYPELAGCTTEVCAFIEEAQVFEKHGIQVVGLSTERSDPPPGCTVIPFPVGVLPQDGLEDVLDFVQKDDRRYAVRTSFLVYPDGTGEAVTGITDVVGHVKRCLEVVSAHRLKRFRAAAVEHLRNEPLAGTILMRGLLANGSDSVAIPQMDLRFEMVAKMADPGIIEAEAGYMRRINDLLAAAGRDLIFPKVLAITTDEQPAWYLMEAASPTPLDLIAFEDAARTRLTGKGKRMMERAVSKAASLYELTFRPEVPAISPYHYAGRFETIASRPDFRKTFERLLPGEDLEMMLGRTLELPDGVRCRPFREQVTFLKENVETLCAPVGAYIHGDLHLPNMLLTPDGADVVLIDPRVVWDGNDVGDPGFCDPMYDFATLFHSLQGMCAILAAVNEGTTEELLDLTPDGRVSEGVLRLSSNPVGAEFLDWITNHADPRILGAGWRARLYVGTANAYFGWLKYARSVQTAGAWKAIFTAVLYDLEMGRRALEEG